MAGIASKCVRRSFRVAVYWWWFLGFLFRSCLVNSSKPMASAMGVLCRARLGGMSG
jgi:hypothetical protein